MAYVTGDMAGSSTVRCTACSACVARPARPAPGGEPIAQYFIRQPDDPTALRRQVGRRVADHLRDLPRHGLAYAVGLVLIYLLVVAQFGSYLLPLIIMAPIPLTVIGVMPGHALLGAQFTATSMIGMIALAGIIVRNSILLVDFINLRSTRRPQPSRTRWSRGARCAPSRSR